MQHGGELGRPSCCRTWRLQCVCTQPRCRPVLGQGFEKAVEWGGEPRGFDQTVGFAPLRFRPRRPSKTALSIATQDGTLLVCSNESLIVVGCSSHHSILQLHFLLTWIFLYEREHNLDFSHYRAYKK